MSNFKIPTREDVSENNQTIFDKLKGALGFVPNLYAYYTKSETALGDYLALQNRKTSLSNKEKEIVNLVTSQINGCNYCKAAHTAVGKMNGFTEDQILEIRGGSISFDAKFDALAKFTTAVVNNKGKVSAEATENFFAAGYNEGSLVDTVVLIGDKTISNYLHNITQFAIDFPAAPSLETANA